MTGEKGEKVLLTGITGYVANYIADLLLKKGYIVVGTLRNVSKIEEFKERYPQQVANGQLQFSDVKDIGAAHAFDKVFKDHPDIKYVIHAASPVAFAADDLKRDIIDPAIAGTLSAVTAAHNYGKQVKRFIQTSSLAAMTHPNDEPGSVYTEDSWSKVTLEEATKDGLLAYYASKKYGEKALWDFMENETPSFDAVSINPPLVLGGHLNKIENPDQVHLALKPFQQFIDVTDKDYKVPPAPFNIYVDVRDLAEFHVLPIENISQITGNKRYLTTAGYFSNQNQFSTHQEKV